MARSPALPLCLVCAACGPGPQPSADAQAPQAWTVVSFNSGTTASVVEPSAAYGEAQAALSDRWYGDGLAWTAAVTDVADWLAAVDPDLVAFQEIFGGDCAEIPEDARVGFICEDWRPGDPSVAEQVLGPEYQVACHLGKADKCLAVHQRLGRFSGCFDALCPDGLDGAPVTGCGSGSRVGRGGVVNDDGQLILTAVGLHGTSGLGPEDQACRVAQFEQVFVDLGDGEPGVNGPLNLVLGDLNTDPGRFAEVDRSAARWLDFVGPGRAFASHTALGADAPGAYGGLADIDHVASDGLKGSCWNAGLDGHPPVTDIAFFDHRPVVCSLSR